MEEIGREEHLEHLDKAKEEIPEKTDIWICWHYPLDNPKELEDMGIQQYSWQRAILCLHEWDRKKVFYTGLEEPFRSNEMHEIDHEVMLSTKTVPNGHLDGDLESWLRNEVSRFNIPFSEVEEELQRVLNDFEDVATGRDNPYMSRAEDDEFGWVVATKYKQQTPP